MPPPSASEVATAIGLTVPAFFSDALDQALQGEANYIATGQPTGAIGQIGQAVARAACRRYGTGASGASGRAAADYERACRPYLDTIDPGKGLGLSTPFPGGQCVGVSYFVQYSFNTVNTDGSPGGTFTPSAGPINGPIRGIVREGAPGSYTAVILSGDGVRSVVNSSSAPQGGLENLKITANLVSGGGAGEDCGDPPPSVTAPPVADPMPPPFRFNPVPGIDITADVTINPDGSITFDVGTGDVTVNPFQDGGGGLTPGDLVPAPGDAGQPVTSGAGGDAAGEAGTGEELVGVQVEVLETTENVNTFDNVAAVVYRGIGYVRMGYPNRLGLDISGGTVLAPQFFHAQQRGLTAWAVRANLGFIVRVTPYYRTSDS